MGKRRAEYLRQIARSLVLAQIKGETLGTLEDGQYLRRALGKLWNIAPGQVISKLAEGSAHVVRHKGKLKFESKAEWYNIPLVVQTRPAHWYNIKHNVRENCSRGKWGGTKRAETMGVHNTNNNNRHAQSTGTNHNIHARPTRTTGYEAGL